MATSQDSLNTLIHSFTQTHSQPYGASEKDREDVAKWIERAARADAASDESIQELDAYLTPRTFLVGNALTAADVAIYAALHPTISKARREEYYAHPALTRYFDHIQTRDGVMGALPPVVFDVEGAPKMQSRQGEVKKEKGAEDQGKQGKKKEKEEKLAAQEGKKGKGQGDESKKGRAPAGNDNTAPVPSMIDLRVGQIVDVKKHPDADSLYIEQIDLGEDSGPRTVVSGLVNYIPIEEMRGRRLVAVCNLKPAAMRGVKSFAMVLCATAKEGREGGIEIVDPPEDAKVGERVYFEGGYEDEMPLEQLNPKKKIFETIQPGFTTLETREAAWVDPVKKSVHRMRTKSGICRAPRFVGASLS